MSRLRRILKPQSRSGRIVRNVGFGALGFLLLLVILLLLPPVRGRALSIALDKVSDALPGELVTTRAAWPGLGRLELDGLLWTQDGDTLLYAPMVRLHVSIGALFKRDVVVEQFSVLGLRADVPALQTVAAALPAAETETEPAGPPPFPRQGAMPPLPSVAVKRARLGLDRVVLADGQGLAEGLVSLSADLRRDHAPVISLDTLRVVAYPESWSVSEARLGWGGEPGALSGRVRAGPTPETALTLDIVPTSRDDFDLVLTMGDAPAIDLAGGGALRLDPPHFDLHVAGAAAGQALKYLGVTVDAPDGAAGEILVGLQAAAFDLDLVTAAAVTIGDSTVIALAPIDVAVDTLVALMDHEPGPLTGRVVVGESGLSLRDLGLTGALGGWTLDGVQDDVRLDLDVVIDWTEPPPALLYHLDLDTLDWPRDETPGLRATVRLAASTPGGALDDGTATASLVLPGPAHFADLLPDVTVDDLGVLIADLEASLTPDPSGPTWRLDLDLSRTAWVDDGRVVAHGGTGASILDTLQIALPGLVAAAAGRVEGERLSFDARVELPDAALVARLPGMAAETDLSVRLDLTADGPAASPALDATVIVAAALPDLDVPRLEGVFHADTDTLDLLVTAPEGLTAGTLTLDAVTVHVTAAGLQSMADGVGFEADATGDLFTADVAGRVAAQPALALTLNTLRLETRGEDLSLQRPFTVAQDSSSGAWRITDLDLSGSLGAITAAGEAAPDKLDLTAGLDLNLPFALMRELAPEASLPTDEDLVLALTGNLSLQGTAAAPQLHGGFGATVTGDDQLADLTLIAELGTAPGRVDAAFHLDRGERRLATGQAMLPVSMSLDPPAFVPSTTDSFAIGFATERLDLSEFADYMPPALGMDGVFEAAIDLRGVGTDATIDGGLDAPRLRLELDDGTWVEFGGEIDLGGTTRRPSVVGGLVIEGGVIVIPDVPPLLLPAEGEALLLTHPQGVSVDSTLVAPVAEPLEMDLTLDLSCPGNFWLRGRGLAIELVGDLQVTQQGAEPAVVGELQAARGTLKFMGRQFEVERGVVSFYGDLESDPQLDLELRSTIEGTTYRIGVMGWALAPELTLSSDPEMTEGDIIASLLFGKPLDELDSGQENLLMERTAQILASLGSTELTDRLSTALGADLISYNQAANEDESSSLMVGKYLSPKLLIKYEQMLDRRNAYFVRLDYTLNRFFRLETSVGQGTESGVELKWARDY